MIKEELLLSKAGKECSVTELLELERKMYQENIDRNQKIHEELRRGTLKEFRNKCQPFEDEQNKNLLRAKVRLQLNQKNINDLLEFELQQAKDVYEEERLQLKKKLLEKAQQRLSQLKQRLHSNTTSFHHLTNSCSSTTGIQDIQENSGELDTTRLKRSIQDASTFAREKFNLRHLEPCIPSSDQIVDQVTQVLTDYESFLATDGATCRNPFTKISSDQEIETIKIDEVVYKPKNDVVLMSSLSKEELYGKIVAISKDHVEVILVCGTSVQVSVENLQQRKCTIRMDTTINEYLSDEFENDQKDTNNNQPETLSSRC